MAFTYDLATDIGKLRLNLGDKTANKGPLPDQSNFSDEELQSLLTQEGNVMRAVAAACEVLATIWSAVSDSQSSGDQSESFGQAGRFRDRAAALRSQYGGASTAFAVSFRRHDGYSVNAGTTTE